jgi:hypothetical protein
MTKLSEQAEYYLSYFVNNPHVRVCATTIMAKFGVSRRKSRAIIQELERAEVVARKRSLRNGTLLVLTPQEGTKLVPWITAVKQYNHSASTAIVPIAVQLEMNNIATNKFLDGVKGSTEKSLGYDYFGPTSGEDSDVLRAREKHEARKKAEYLATRQKKADAKDLVHRSKVDPLLWTCKDIAYEFATRLGEHWEIAPFSVTQTRLVQALATFRRQHDTNGAIELELVNLFFENLRSEKLTDGNHAWRAFLFKAPQLLPTARERVITPEQLETAIIDDTARAERKLSLFDEDDDV